MKDIINPNVEIPDDQVAMAFFRSVRWVNGVLMSTVGETREGLEDMCARIVALTSMTFQELSSIRVKYL